MWISGLDGRNWHRSNGVSTELWRLFLLNFVNVYDHHSIRTVLSCAILVQRHPVHSSLFLCLFFPFNLPCKLGLPQFPWTFIYHVSHLTGYTRIGCCTFVVPFRHLEVGVGTMVGLASFVFYCIVICSQLTCIQHLQNCLTSTQLLYCMEGRTDFYYLFWIELQSVAWT